MLKATCMVIVVAALAVLWPAGAPRAQSGIEGHEWRIAGLDGTAANDAGTLTLRDGRITGKAACNRYFAQLIAGPDNGKLELGPIGATRIYCDGKMEKEKALFDALAKVRGYRLDANSLVLNDAGGKAVVLLTR